MGDALTNRPDLLSRVMTVQEAEEASALLKRSCLSYFEHADAIAFHTRMTEKEKAAACEAAFRLKENDNWKLVDPSYRSWGEFCKNEFSGRVRQEVDRWVAEHTVKRIMPEDLQVKSGLQSRVMAQIPDEMKVEIYTEAKASAPTNRFTGLKQLSAKQIAEVAQKKGVVITGLPGGAKPEPVGQQAETPKAKADRLADELKNIRDRAKVVQQMAAETEDSVLLKLYRAFIDAIIGGIGESLGEAVPA